MTAVQIDLFAGALDKAAPDRKGQRQRKPHEMACCACSMTWSEGVERPDWGWVDEGVIGMMECARCARDVCHNCWARNDETSMPSALCPECFAKPEPPSDAEIVVAWPIYADRPDVIRRSIAWRYEEPLGQTCSFNPLLVAFWKDAAEGGHQNLTARKRAELWDKANSLNPGRAADGGA